MSVMRATCHLEIHHPCPSIKLDNMSNTHLLDPLVKVEDLEADIGTFDPIAEHSSEPNVFTKAK